MRCAEHWVAICMQRRIDGWSNITVMTRSSKAVRHWWVALLDCCRQALIALLLTYAERSEVHVCGWSSDCNAFRMICESARYLQSWWSSLYCLQSSWLWPCNILCCLISQLQLALHGLCPEFLRQMWLEKLCQWDVAMFVWMTPFSSGHKNSSMIWPWVVSMCHMMDLPAVYRDKHGDTHWWDIQLCPFPLHEAPGHHPHIGCTQLIQL